MSEAHLTLLPKFLSQRPLLNFLKGVLVGVLHPKAGIRWQIFCHAYMLIQLCIVH